MVAVGRLAPPDEVPPRSLEAGILYSSRPGDLGAHEAVRAPPQHPAGESARTS